MTDEMLRRLVPENADLTEIAIANYATANIITEEVLGKKLVKRKVVEKKKEFIPKWKKEK